MAKYIVTGLVTGTGWVNVEAETEEEAREKALACGVASLCHACPQASDDEWTYEMDDLVETILEVEKQ